MLCLISYACKQFLDNWSELEQYCEYRVDNIPQLEDINRLVTMAMCRNIK